MLINIHRFIKTWLGAVWRGDLERSRICSFYSGNGGEADRVGLSGWTGRTRDAAGVREGDRRGKEEEEEERVRGTLDFSPRRHADLNGGLAPGARRRRPPSTAS